MVWVVVASCAALAFFMAGLEAGLMMGFPERDTMLRLLATLVAAGASMAVALAMLAGA